MRLLKGIAFRNEVERIACQLFQSPSKLESKKKILIN